MYSIGYGVELWTSPHGGAEQPLVVMVGMRRAQVAWRMEDSNIVKDGVEFRLVEGKEIECEDSMCRTALMRK